MLATINERQNVELIIGPKHPGYERLLAAALRRDHPEWPEDYLQSYVEVLKRRALRSGIAEG